jgi:dihydroxyacetone kinase-like protein
MGHLSMSDDVTTAVFEDWVRRFARLIAENREHLTELDAAIGDADHGSNMDRGMKAAVAALDDSPPANASALLSKVGMTLVSTVGGASGPLFGTMFMRMGASLGPAGDTVSAGALATALRAGLGGVVDRGKAAPGDKTMYDALAPAVEAFERSLAADGSLAEGLDSARYAAAAGRDATTPMLARKGRASYLGERSVGHQDPGAASVALLLEAAAAAAAAASADTAGAPGALSTDDPAAVNGAAGTAT